MMARPMKQSFGHHNAPLLVAALTLNPNSISHSKSLVVTGKISYIVFRA
jgi:hypothetical protein